MLKLFIQYKTNKCILIQIIYTLKNHNLISNLNTIN